MTAGDNRLDYLLSLNKENLTFYLSYTNDKSKEKNSPIFFISYALYSF